MIGVKFKYVDKGLDSFDRNMGVASSALTTWMASKCLEVAIERSRVDTGNMQSHWFKRVWAGVLRSTSQVYNTVPYTVYHEYGTSKMKAQPMLQPGIDAVMAELPYKTEELLKVILQGGY